MITNRSGIKFCNGKMTKNRTKQFKHELMDVFKKHCCLTDDNNLEVKIKITAGNIAWININCIEIIK